MTAYDVEIQRFLMEKLKTEATFLGEEDAQGNRRGYLPKDCIFAIEPVDCAANFMFEYHSSYVLPGVACGGKLTSGYVYNPYVDEMYPVSRVFI